MDEIRSRSTAISSSLVLLVHRIPEIQSRRKKNRNITASPASSPQSQQRGAPPLSDATVPLLLLTTAPSLATSTQQLPAPTTLNAP